MYAMDTWAREGSWLLRTRRSASLPRLVVPVFSLMKTKRKPELGYPQFFTSPQATKYRYYNYVFDNKRNYKKNLPLGDQYLIPTPYLRHFCVPITVPDCRNICCVCPALAKTKFYLKVVPNFRVSLVLYAKNKLKKIIFTFNKNINHVKYKRFVI